MSAAGGSSSSSSSAAANNEFYKLEENSSASQLDSEREVPLNSTFENTCTEPSQIEGEDTIMMNEDDGFMEASDFFRTPSQHTANTIQLSSTPNISLNSTRVPLVMPQTTVPIVLEEVAEPQKRVPLVKGGRRRPNTSERAVNSLVDAARKREAVLSMEIEIKKKESEQRLEMERAEHDSRMRTEEKRRHVEELKIIVEEERIKTLVAKRAYYEFLTKKEC